MSVPHPRSLSPTSVVRWIKFSRRGTPSHVLSAHGTDGFVFFSALPILEWRPFLIRPTLSRVEKWETSLFEHGSPFIRENEPLLHRCDIAPNNRIGLPLIGSALIQIRRQHRHVAAEDSGTRLKREKADVRRGVAGAAISRTRSVRDMPTASVVKARGGSGTQRG